MDLTKYTRGNSNITIRLMRVGIENIDWIKLSSIEIRPMNRRGTGADTLIRAYVSLDGTDLAYDGEFDPAIALDMHTTNSEFREIKTGPSGTEEYPACGYFRFEGTIAREKITLQDPEEAIEVEGELEDHEGTYKQVRYCPDTYPLTKDLWGVDLEILGSIID